MEYMPHKSSAILDDGLHQIDITYYTEDSRPQPITKREITEMSLYMSYKKYSYTENRLWTDDLIEILTKSKERVLHSFQDTPSFAVRMSGKDPILCGYWHQHGLTHRDDDYAFFSGNENNPKDRVWYKLGKIHRTDGPAIISTGYYGDLWFWEGQKIMLDDSKKNRKFFVNLETYQRFLYNLLDTEMMKKINEGLPHWRWEYSLYINFMRNLEKNGPVNSNLFYLEKNTYIPFNTL